MQDKLHSENVFLHLRLKDSPGESRVPIHLRNVPHQLLCSLLALNIRGKCSSFCRKQALLGKRRQVLFRHFSIFLQFKDIRKIPKNCLNIQQELRFLLKLKPDPASGRLTVKQRL